MMRKYGLIFFICALLLAGCGAADNGVPAAAVNGEATHNPTAQEVLRDNPAADFFQLGGVIYMNAASIDWVQQLESLTVQEQIGTIAKTYEAGAAFEDGMATKLPAGAGIYRPSTNGSSILIVKWNGREVRYLAMLEG